MRNYGEIESFYKYCTCFHWWTQCKKHHIVMFFTLQLLESNIYDCPSMTFPIMWNKRTASWTLFHITHRAKFVTLLALLLLMCIVVGNHFYNLVLYQCFNCFRKQSCFQRVATVCSWTYVCRMASVSYQLCDINLLNLITYHQKRSAKSNTFVGEILFKINSETSLLSAGICSVLFV